MAKLEGVSARRFNWLYAVGTKVFACDENGGRGRLVKTVAPAKEGADDQDFVEVEDQGEKLRFPLTRISTVLSPKREVTADDLARALRDSDRPGWLNDVLYDVDLLEADRETPTLSGRMVLAAFALGASASHKLHIEQQEKRDAVEAERFEVVKTLQEVSCGLSARYGSSLVAHVYYDRRILVESYHTETLELGTIGHVGGLWFPNVVHGDGWRRPVKDADELMAALLTLVREKESHLETFAAKAKEAFERDMQASGNEAGSEVAHVQAKEPSGIKLSNLATVAGIIALNASTALADGGWMIVTLTLFRKRDWNRVEKVATSMPGVSMIDVLSTYWKSETESATKKDDMVCAGSRATLGLSVAFVLAHRTGAGKQVFLKLVQGLSGAGIAIAGASAWTGTEMLMSTSNLYVDKDAPGTHEPPSEGPGETPAETDPKTVN